ncbi:subtilisin family serine protease [Streptomyces sp. LBL]|uniref:S8 family serine peptidase n=1 Tax=Streptomyces sp. LBL TaxID=2940562 RepID=UPI002473C1C7|nr:S8 family serine peptidase [Streptomyces sp. LBL]MDH6626444.1 subtilisin family serine protease [Streptomyces sp. LBL]
MSSWTRSGAVAITAALALGMAPGIRPGPSAAAETAPAGGTAQSGGRTVTLITGDTVTTDGAGRVTGVRAGAGREDVTISVHRYQGRSYVIPEDAMRPLTEGTVDRRLFDVTELLASGYDDARRDSTPLIVTYRTSGEASAKRELAAADADAGRDLSVINGQAVEAPRSGTARVWNALTDAGTGARAGATRVASGIEKVWLDAARTASLDQSVPQIGAPTAWASGYDGKGVTIAVLDTGVDQTHPDLADREIAEKNFGSSPDNVDRVGHGTHVASIAAGSGAKSGGRYKGVAPGAKILDGKVLDDSGSGSESGIIAGMQWAVDQHANVVNLSLGGTDTAGIDPLEEAVNTLSAKSGTLFVIAAGNSGPLAGTIGSPGSAAAALTVGAVDKQNRIATFSSVGPTQDGSLKPDLTAPGRFIVAAKAAEGVIGTPAGDGYVSLNGTSMATPHVAGAAAILAQRHPDWTGQQLKQALVSSAKPTAGLTAQQQGTGRVDVARAVAQTVSSEVSSVGFGTQQWPHTDDTPLTKRITYRNTGTSAVTLGLSVRATDADGKSAPRGLFTVSSKRVTVPAGGTASVDVTADTRTVPAGGAYSGALLATGGGQSVRTAVAADAEVESYDLTMNVLDGNGDPAFFPFIILYGLDGPVLLWSQGITDGVARFRAPKGAYNVFANVSTWSGAGAGSVELVQPRLSVTKDTRTVLDAREAKPVSLTPPDPDATSNGAYASYVMRAAGSSLAVGVLNGSDVSRLRIAQSGGAASPAAGFEAQVGATFSKGTGTAYDLLYTRSGSFFDGFSHTTSTSELARADIAVGAPAAGKTGSVGAVWYSPVGESYSVPAADFALPGSQRHYVTVPKGYTWGFDFVQKGADGGHETFQSSADRTYRAGRSYSETFNTGVFGPSLGEGPGGGGVSRLGDDIAICLPQFADGSGHLGDSVTGTGKVTLTSGGVPYVYSTATALARKYLRCRSVTTLPAARQSYRLTTDFSRPAEVSGLSSRVSASWTFVSGRVSGTREAMLPLSSVRFAPELTSTGTAKAGTRLTVPLVVEGAAATRGVKALAVEVSYDAGTTWRKTDVRSSGSTRQVTLAHPSDAGSVSFRARLTDKGGNTHTVTIIDAYLLTR